MCFSLRFVSFLFAFFLRLCVSLRVRACVFIFLAEFFCRVFRDDFPLSFVFLEYRTSSMKRRKERRRKAWDPETTCLFFFRLYLLSYVCMRAFHIFTFSHFLYLLLFMIFRLIISSGSFRSFH